VWTHGCGAVYTRGLDHHVRFHDRQALPQRPQPGCPPAARVPLRRRPGAGSSRRQRRDARADPHPQGWFAELDRFGPEPFMAEGRDQPGTPVGRDLG
jgi:hypothetical protein